MAPSRASADVVAPLLATAPACVLACHVFLRTRLVFFLPCHAMPCRPQYLERWCETTAGGGTVKASDECKVMTFDFIINVCKGCDGVRGSGLCDMVCRVLHMLGPV